MSRGLVVFLAGILCLIGSACAAAPGNRASEQFVFPPTATLPATPIAAAPAQIALATTKSAVLTVPGGAVPRSTRVQKEAMATKSMPTVTTTFTPLPPTPAPSATPLPSATPCGVPGTMVTGQFESQLAGLMSYRVYLPPCYSELGRTYPALYMLPGNIHTDSIWDELGLDEAAEAGIREEILPPLLIVMVSGGSLANNTSGGPFSYETFLMEEFIPFIEGTYCVWPYAEGRAIGGLSRGGYWALEIAFRHAQEFASVGGHSAALVDYNGGPTINPLQTGLENDLNGLRIYLDFGESDWLISNTRELHEQLELAGREHTWVLNEGWHEDAYWASHVGDYLAWYAEPWLTIEGGYLPCRAVSAGYSP